MQNLVHRIPGLVITDHEFNIPLDHNNPDEKTITVFGREIIAPDKEHDDLPWLLFLQQGKEHLNFVSMKKGFQEMRNTGYIAAEKHIHPLIKQSE